MKRDLSREAHLWYTITSPSFVAHAKVRLQAAFDFLRAGFQRKPEMADYPPVPYWGGVMEELLSTFDSAFAILEAGEFEPMQRWASKLKNVPRGFGESNLNWLKPDEQEKFLDLLNDAYSVCSEFLSGVTMSQMYSDDRYKDGSADWHYDIPEDMGIVSNNILRHHEDAIYAVVGRPVQIPEYAADTRVTCRTGAVVPWTGVWVPNSGMGTAALAFARQGVQIMQPAYELEEEVDEDDYPEASKRVDTTWYPLKPTGRMLPLPGSSGVDALRVGQGSSREGVGRCEAGQPCPRAGVWFTPASLDSRRHFRHGEIMPSMGGDYGLTIWQWAPDQEG